MKMLAAILCALSLPSLVTAQVKDKNNGAGETIQGSGCVESGVEANCIVLKDKKTGELYNLYFEPDKAPKIGAGISFQGRARDGATICMQGKPVRVQKWAANDNVCQSPKSKIGIDTPQK